MLVPCNVLLSNDNDVITFISLNKRSFKIILCIFFDCIHSKIIYGILLIISDDSSSKNIYLHMFVSVMVDFNSNLQKLVGGSILYNTRVNLCNIFLDNGKFSKANKIVHNVYSNVVFGIMCTNLRFN
ncbi:hypothetical protein MRV_0094 [Murid herpesvirus 3]|uniref:Uncharacterized protein n=2 Tax=Murid betaherpesvirus 3 TaxID=2560603 RepID=A0A1P8VIY6_9BETA|nr:hypothetical protein MRV_0094 [Murine roseolovirus]APZ76305.1 hypothetical protein MRV_0094 [Murid betaherpesvirus 3]AYH64804.1 hypothetical protein MRV_0094 [Murid herpesvirus 3]